MSRRRGRAEPAGHHFVLVQVQGVEQRGLGVRAEEDEMGPRWWKKCQRTLSSPSLRLLWALTQL